MTKGKYTVGVCQGGYIVERTMWKRTDNMRLTAVREIAGVFLGDGNGDDHGLGFAITAAFNFCEDLNKILPLIEQRAFAVFKRPALVEQLAAL